MRVPSTRAHMWASLLVAVFALPGCADNGTQTDLFVAPGAASQVMAPRDSLRLDVGKVAILSVKMMDPNNPSAVRVVAAPKPNIFTTVTSTVPAGASATAPATAWGTSDPNVATVSGKGVVTAVAPGTATVTGTTAGGPATISVTVPPPSVTTPSDTSTGSTPGGAELPRVTVDVTMPNGTGRSIMVNAGDDLQAAINSASPGDQLLLQAGATFTGNFTLPVKAGSGWVVISTRGALPSAGTRVHPSDAPQMAKIVSQDPTFPAIATALGAHNYRLIGLEVTAPVGATQAYSLVNLGDGSGGQNTLASMAHDLVLDRMYVHGTPTLHFQRCISLNSGSAAIVDSYISECHTTGFDSQAIAGWNGSGPYRIEDNYLEASGENLMFGGADPQIANMLPRDIVVRHNYLYKPPTWKGVWEVKNLMEFKLGQRILIDGNVFENNWSDAQDGTAILLKSVNQNGAAPWSQTSDLTFQNNIVKNVAHAMNISAHPEINPVVLAARIKIANNVFYKVGDGDYPGGRLFIVSGIQGLTIANNTAFPTAFSVYMTGVNPKIAQLVIENNLFGGWGISSADGLGAGTAGLNAHAAAGWVVRKNVVVGANASAYPSDNLYPATQAAIGLDANYNLPAGSPYLTASTTGGAVGANLGTITSATTGVTQ